MISPPLALPVVDAEMLQGWDKQLLSLVKVPVARKLPPAVM
ncbi:hypothetical protein QUB33_02915 [Microcoleus sp. B3-A4]